MACAAPAAADERDGRDDGQDEDGDEQAEEVSHAPGLPAAGGPVVLGCARARGRGCWGWCSSPGARPGAPRRPPHPAAVGHARAVARQREPPPAPGRARRRRAGRRSTSSGCSCARGWSSTCRRPCGRTSCAPGRRLAFPVDVRRRRLCAATLAGAASSSATAPATALHEVVLDVPADDPLLPRLHRRECDLARARARPSTSFDEGAWRRDGDGGQRAAGRAADAAARRRSARRRWRAASCSRCDAGAALPAVLADQPRRSGARRGRRPRAATSTRSSRASAATTSRTSVPLGGGEPLSVTVRPARDGRRAARAAARRRCAPD